jgi:glycosyltransferase involved in cell wall biosynthesis
VNSLFPLVSIVIPNYNCGEFISECLISAINQTYPNKEIIVIDDGSTDDSVHVLSIFKDQIHLIQTTNRGAAAARNLGISMAKGEFIAFLDSDDSWELDKISLQIKKMIDENCDLVYCSANVVTQGESVKKVNVAEYDGDCYPYFLRFPTKAIIILGCSGAVIRSSRIESSGMFDETFAGSAEDWDFFRRYCKGAKVGFISDPLFNYRRHIASVSHRPVSDWYYGNVRAVRKMIFDDSDVTFIERRIIWTKFQLLAIKTFASSKEVILCMGAIAALFSPIYLDKNFKTALPANKFMDSPKVRN